MFEMLFNIFWEYQNIINIDDDERGIRTEYFIHNPLEFRRSIFKSKWHYIPFVMSKWYYECCFISVWDMNLNLPKILTSYQILRIFWQNKSFEVDLSCLVWDIWFIGELCSELCSWLHVFGNPLLISKCLLT